MVEFKAESEWICNGTARIKIRKFNIDVTSPLEISDPEKAIAPEEVFPGVLASCILTTFLYLKDRMNIHLEKWSSNVEASLDVTQKEGFQYISIHVHIFIKVPQSEKDKIPKIIDLSHKYCPISKAIKGNVNELVDFEFID